VAKYAAIDLLTLESCHVKPLGCSTPVGLPSLNWIRLTVMELRRLKFSIDRQLVPIFTLLGVKGSNFKFHLSNPDRHFLGGNDV